MRTPCEVITREVLPLLRALVARKLRKHGLTVPEIARILGVPPSSVSKYLRKTDISHLGELADKLEEFSEKLAARIVETKADGLDSSKIIEEVCRWCINLKLSNMICPLHRSLVSDLTSCRACFAVLVQAEYAAQERISVINELLEAFKELSDDALLVKLVPEVRTNIAYAVKNAQKIEDVAAFPGRITVVRGRLAAVSLPEFGASKHLAKVLLVFMEKFPEERCSMCIKYNADVRRALEKLHVGVIYLRRESGDEEELLAKLRKRLEGLAQPPSAVVDLGGAGIEPVVYLFAENPRELVKLVKKIEQALS